MNFRDFTHFPLFLDHFRVIGTEGGRHGRTVAGPTWLKRENMGLFNVQNVDPRGVPEVSINGHTEDWPTVLDTPNREKVHKK